MGKKTGKRYSEEQIIRILGELKSGKTAEEVCRTYTSPLNPLSVSASLGEGTFRSRGLAPLLHIGEGAGE
jgi:hypothetical protein